MTNIDIAASLPFIITAYTGVALMLIAPFWKNRSAIFVLAVAGLLAALVASIPLAYDGGGPVTELISVNWYSAYFLWIILAASILTAFLAREYLESHSKSSSAFYILLVFATLGMEITACSVHMASFFLGVETLSLSLYGLIGYTRQYRPSIEAAMKYLVIAATSSAFLLFGIALIYADTGTMDLVRIGHMVAARQVTAMTSLGLALTLVMFGFKLALAPFHMWSPDVYQGAPSPVTAVIATGSKGAVLATLMAFANVMWAGQERVLLPMLTTLSIVTMLAGNLLALRQRNVKRLLAYSSVAHMGYLLLAVISQDRGVAPMRFYLTIYFATTIAAFGVIAALSARRSVGEVETIEEYRGLAYRRPILAACMGIALLSLTGIPPTAGFIAKFYLFAGAASAGRWPLVIVAILNSGVSAFYYLRLLVTMYTQPDADTPEPPARAPFAEFAVVLSTLVILVLGVYPSPLLSLLHQIAGR